MARVSSLVPAADDPAPGVAWEIIYSDNFDRECPPSTEITGRGVIPGLVELWARFLFETVKLAQTRSADGVWTDVGTHGFADFYIQFADAPSETIAGNWDHAVQIKRWVYGTEQTKTIAREDADVALLRTIAQAHARLRVARPRDAGEQIVACATDSDRAAFVARLAAL